MKYFHSLLIICVAFQIGMAGQCFKGIVQTTSKEPIFITIPDKNLSITLDTFYHFQVCELPENFRILISQFGNNPIDTVLKNSIGSFLFALKPILSVTTKETTISSAGGTKSSIQAVMPFQIYAMADLNKNFSTNLIEAIGNINGIKSQVACNVCGTTEITINGIQGPYTLILMDGVPLVSTLGAVYGLSGIPTSLIDRIEVQKGPYSTPYGYEAIGGTINIISKKIPNLKKWNLNLTSNTWLENQIELSKNYEISKNWTGISALNLFYFGLKNDFNKDNFMDVPLQKRISLYNKLTSNNLKNWNYNIVSRVFLEERMGGQLNFSPEFKGTDSIYGEYITTKRVELLGNMVSQKIKDFQINYSLVGHQQNSFYGLTHYQAFQFTGFLQAVKQYTYKFNQFTTGINLRYENYDDNSTATQLNGINNPENNFIPAIFIQDKIELNKKNYLSLAIRDDYHPIHKNIFSPNVGFRHYFSDIHFINFAFGTGFRPVRLFSEDHAALTGSRQVIIDEKLKPESSKALALNYEFGKYNDNGNSFKINISGYFNYFSNKIQPDYLTNSNQIIYNNLNGYAIYKGISIQPEFVFKNKIKATLGLSFMDNAIFNKNSENELTKNRILLSEQFSGNFSVSYYKEHYSIDLTANLKGPMLMPTLGVNDTRPQLSPIYSIWNIQGSFEFTESSKIKLGVKNIFNYLPFKHIPFLMANANNPFDKNVQFDDKGNPLKTASNPSGLTFDTEYNYAPNQGAKLFVTWDLLF